MPYGKRIVCLANSRKMAGRCIAGKEYSREKDFEGWIRPVSSRPSQEITLDERRYENGEDPKLLDIITMQLLEQIPNGHQTENHLIDSSYYWVKGGAVNWEDLDDALDPFDGSLWIDGNSSYNGENDRIPETEMPKLDNSLTLVGVEDLVIRVAHEGINQKRKVRAHFSLGEKQYVIAVTDPEGERQFLAKENGEYLIGIARLCISIGEPFQNFCYKLVAGIITP